MDKGEGHPPLGLVLGKGHAEEPHEGRLAREHQGGHEEDPGHGEQVGQHEGPGPQQQSARSHPQQPGRQRQGQRLDQNQEQGLGGLHLHEGPEAGDGFLGTQGRLGGAARRDRRRRSDLGAFQFLRGHLHGHGRDAAQGGGRQGPGRRREGGLGQGGGLEEQGAALPGRCQGQPAFGALRREGREAGLAAGADAPGRGRHPPTIGHPATAGNPRNEKAPRGAPSR